MEENKYNPNGRALSFSTLKNLSYSPGLFRAMLLKKTTSKALTIGKMIDTMLLEPEKFEEYYSARKAKVPTGMMLDYTNAYIEKENHNYAYAVSGYKQDRDMVREKFERDCKEYYEEQKAINEQKKLFYAEEEYSTVIKVVESIQQNEKIFNCFKALEDEEFFGQLEILWEYKGIQLKSILDILKINHSKKLITIYDLKTTGDSINNFITSIEKYQYWLQMAMYGLAVLYKFKESIKNIEEYSVEFKWIVESTKYPGSPIIYKMSESDAKKGVEGGKINGVWQKGFQQLIDDYIWHTDNNEWTYKREIIESEFECDISIFN